MNLFHYDARNILYYTMHFDRVTSILRYFGQGDDCFEEYPEVNL